jgi:hypothetical protein
MSPRPAVIRSLALLTLSVSLLSACGLVNAPSPPPPPASVVSVTPDRLDFPDTVVGTRSPAQRFSVTNHTAAPVTFSSVFIMDHPRAYLVDAKDCHPHLAPGATCTVTVIFRPNATGDMHAQLHLPRRPATWTFVRSLSGTGIPATP